LLKDSPIATSRCDDDWETQVFGKNRSRGVYTTLYEKH